MGREVRFQTGTDEHGLKMAQTARGRGVEPSLLADEMSSYFKEMDDVLNITYDRSEEHTSELQSLMRISYAVFCLKKKKNYKNTNNGAVLHSTKKIKRS